MFEFVKTSPENLGANYLKNKLAQTIAFVFILTFQTSWTSFFDDFLTILAAPNSPIGNPVNVDLYLRILKVVHEEIGDNLINREAVITKRNNAIKDQIRANDINKITDSWFEILKHYLDSNSEIVEGVLNVIGGWVSWVDITLIINNEFIPLVYKSLQSHTLTTCDTLIEIMYKKMKPFDKMEVIRLLGLKDVLSRLSPDERVGKLANIVLLELVHILDGSTATASNASMSTQQLEQADEMLVEFFPIVVEYLSNEDNDISGQVLGSLSEYLSFVRKESKLAKSKVDTSKMEKNISNQVLNFPSDSNFISSLRRQLLYTLLRSLVLKLKYNEDDWDDGENEEFIDFRNKIKLLQDLIAAIDSDLYIDIISSVVLSAFDPASVSSWTEVELGLYELAAYSDSLKNGSMTIVKGIETRPTGTLSKLFFDMIDTNVVTMNHPSIQLLYMELVNRHCTLFNSNNTDKLTKALESFVSSLGVHNPDKVVRLRSWFLFYRFLKSVKPLVGDIAQNIFSSISSLLDIKAPPVSNDSDEDPVFESQLFLFELCGLMFNTSSNKITLIKGLLQPIFSNVETILLQNNSNPLQIHHDIMAIGTFARGFQPENNSEIDSQALQEFKTATQVVTTSVERLGNSELVRDAARFAIARLIPLLGMDILSEVTRLITCFLDQCRAEEVTDFLSFLGHLLHTFRKERGMYDMFDLLLSPLLKKIFAALNDIPAENGSTDIAIINRDLRRAYLQFIFNVLNNGMGAIFFSEKNMDIYESILQSVLLYASNNEDDQSVKLAVITLNKMIQVWGLGLVKADDFDAGKKVPGFEQFVFEHVSRVCLEVAKSSQKGAILSDLSLLQYTIYEVSGDEYLKYLGGFLGNLGVPSEYTNEYLKRLSEKNLKAFKTFFVVSASNHWY